MTRQDFFFGNNHDFNETLFDQVCNLGFLPISVLIIILLPVR